MLDYKYSSFSLLSLLSILKESNIKCVEIIVQRISTDGTSWLSWLWNKSGSFLQQKYQNKGYNIEFDDKFGRLLTLFSHLDDDVDQHCILINKINQSTGNIEQDGANSDNGEDMVNID